MIRRANGVWPAAGVARAAARAGSVVLLGALPAVAAAAQLQPVPVVVETHEVGMLDLRAAADIVKPLLSPDGRVVEERRIHRLVVVDRPSVQRRVAAALQRARESPAPNVRLRVTTEWRTREQGSRLELGGGRRGVTLGGGPTSSRSTRTERQEIVVLSGSRGSLRLAEEIPAPDWFLIWGADRGLLARGTRWREVGSSLVVEPTVLGQGRIRVRLTPQLSYLVDDRRQETAIHQLSTEVVVQAGEEMHLGGIASSDREFRERFLLGYDQARGTQQVGVRLTATLE